MCCPARRMTKNTRVMPFGLSCAGWRGGLLVRSSLLVDHRGSSWVVGVMVGVGATCVRRGCDVRATCVRRARDVRATQWLDLSFNNISKIEGLDKLTKLTDLSLFNNLIQASSVGHSPSLPPE